MTDQKVVSSNVGPTTPVYRGATQQTPTIAPTSVTTGTAKFAQIPLMEYSNARPNVRTGDLLLCSGRWLFSRLIESYTKSIFSHVGLFVWWHERLLVFESVEHSGVRMSPASFYVSNYAFGGKAYNGDLYIGKVSPDLADAALDKMLGFGGDELCRPYGWKQLWAALLLLTPLSQKANQSYVCSEFVGALLAHAGLAKFTPKGQVLSPEDIAADPRVRAFAKIKLV